MSRSTGEKLLFRLRRQDNVSTDELKGYYDRASGYLCRAGEIHGSLGALSNHDMKRTIINTISHMSRVADELTARR